MRDPVIKNLKTLQGVQIDVAYNIEEWKKFVMAPLDLNGPLSYI